jgi:hypothetical protein
MLIFYLPCIIILLLYVLLYKSMKHHFIIHALSLVLYIIYYLYLCNINICGCSNIFRRPVYNLTNLNVLNDGFNLYESSFFIKKKSVMLKLKNINHHIGGFNITTNFFISVYIFYKTVTNKILFSIEYVYFSVVFICILLLGFVKVILFGVQQKTTTYY